MPASSPLHRRPSVTILLAFALLAAGATAGLALAKSPPTLRVAKNVHVTNNGSAVKPFRVKAVNVHEAVAVGPAGYAVYTFQGETTHHIICKKTNNANTNCWAFWPPVTPSSKSVSKAPGIKGKLGTFRNHGVLQLTLNGRPLYYFTPDISSHNKKQAMGDELKTFGSIWHIVKEGGAAQQAAPQQSAPMSSTSTTSTPPYQYPPSP
jgi:predicted lipoprotein with Yx(FWY)xxD motif